jgi:hypothetical protein
MKAKCTSLIIILFIFMTNNTFSFDLGSWNIINLKYKQNQHLSYFAEAQLRSLKF